MSEQIRPYKIRLEASSVCQLRCHACPNASKSILPTVGYGFLQLSDFQMLLDDNPCISEIELSNYGEIFLNPDLLGIIKHAYERKVILTADNGVNLNNVNREVLEGLVKYQFRTITVSIDGTCNETYKRYRIGGNYDLVIDNIKKINLFKQQYHSKYPFLSWQFVVFGHNEQEIQKARLMAHNLDMRFQVKLSWDSSFSPVKDLEEIRKETGAATREEFKQKYGKNYKSNICNQLWDGPQINWDGKVLGCSRNFWGDFGGNVFTDGLFESINNEKISFAREMLLGKNKARPDIPCASCILFLEMAACKTWLDRGFFYCIGHMRKSIPIFLMQYPLIYKALRTLRNSFRYR